MAKKRMKSASSKTEKLYTFLVSVSFEMQFTFNEKEIVHAEDGDENSVDPSERALSKLEREVAKYLSQQYPVEKVEAFAEFDNLLGILE